MKEVSVLELGQPSSKLVELGIILFHLTKGQVILFPLFLELCMKITAFVEELFILIVHLLLKSSDYCLALPRIGKLNKEELRFTTARGYLRAKLFQVLMTLGSIWEQANRVLQV
jgi:hypothetical protein